MRPVLALALRRGRGRLISLAIAVALFLYLVGLSYAAVDQNQIRQLYESLPPALRAFSGAGDIASPGGYLGSTFIHPVPLVIQSAVAISFATGPARDLESGVAELMLSRPLTPRAWLGAHTLATFIGVLLVATTAFLGAAVSVLTVTDLGVISMADLVAGALAGLLLFSAIGGISLLCSTVIRTGARSVGWAAGIIVVMYALNYLGQVWTVVEPLRPLTLFNYYDPGVIVSRGDLALVDALALGGVALVTTALAHVLIGRREVAG